VIPCIYSSDTSISKLWSINENISENRGFPIASYYLSTSHGHFLSSNSNRWWYPALQLLLEKSHYFSLQFRHFNHLSINLWSHNDNISEFGGFSIAGYSNHHIDSFCVQIVIDDGILFCNHYLMRTFTFLNSLDTSIIYE
jgi:hypothetical protein